jgi:hypothetical protein
MTPKEVYCSFLLRIWVEETDGRQWRFSLEDTRTGKRRGFTSLYKLIEYLDKIEEKDCSPEEDR